MPHRTLGMAPSHLYLHIMWDNYVKYFLFYGGAVLWVSIPWQAYKVASLAVEGGKKYSTTILALPECYTVQSGKQHTMNFFIVDGVFLWTAVVWKEVLPFHHWSSGLGSMSYELGYMGHLWVLSAISWRSSTERRKKPYGRTTQRCSTDCLVISFSQGLLLDRSEILPGSSLSHLDLWCMRLTSGYVGHLWVIFSVSLRSCTERHGDFSESVVSLFSWGVLVVFWSFVCLAVVLFVLACCLCCWTVAS